MIFRVLSAILRAGIVFFMIVFPSSVLATAQGGGFGAFVIFALLAALIVFFEYVSSTPSLIEFRHAPPYNRFRVLVFGFISIYMISVMNLHNQVGPIFDLVNGLSRMASGFFNYVFNPVPGVINVLGIEGASDRAEFTKLAEGSLFVALLSTLLFCVIIAMQSWPLGNKGFNLWPNMPSFHTRTGSKTETRMLQVGILSIAMAITLPYLFGQVVQLVKFAFSFDYNYTRHSAFWIIAVWVVVPCMSLIRAIALLKVAYLAQELRSMNDQRDMPAG